MSKSKFYYDKKSLSFKEIKISNTSRIINASTFIFTAFFFGVVSLFILISTPYLNTPTELAQERELKNLLLWVSPEVQVKQLSKSGYFRF